MSHSRRSAGVGDVMNDSFMPSSVMNDPFMTSRPANATAAGLATWDDTPGVSPGYFDALGEQAGLADGLEKQIQAHLKQATEIDEELARNLEVVFGTQDNDHAA